MKKIHLFKIAILSVFLIGLLFMAGCRGSYNTSTNVIVQLQNGGYNYPVDGMTVSLQQRTGTIFTGVTDAEGKATINVTLEGDYNVIQVAGVDASALAEGNDTGREFGKTNPIENPYPNLTYTFPSGSIPAVNVPDFDNNYTINVTVPRIIKVTVLKVNSVTSATTGSATVSAGTAGFAGRVMISNISSNDANFSMGIWSNDAKRNRLILYATTTIVSGGSFYGGTPLTPNDIGSIASYTQAGPLYFEATGTDGGDWALGYNLSTTELKTRNGLGGADLNYNFPQFDGGVGSFVFNINATGGSEPHNYSFDYRIFKFEQFAPCYDIGDTGPGGGTVFYITDGGLHGLEAAPALWDGGSADPISAWSNITSTAIGTTGTAIGTGLANSNAIIAQSGHSASAANLCRVYTGGSMSDWFLPSEDELSQMYALRSVVGGLSAGDSYWSSSEANSSDAILVQNTDGVSANMGKNTPEWVRAVRAF